MRLADLPHIVVSSIQDGAAGTRETLKEMARIVRQYRIPYSTEASYIVRTAGVQAGFFRGEVDAIFNYVRDSIRYIQDPVDVQALRTPDITLAMHAGNCAQKSILLATFLEAAGHKARFVALGYSGNPEEFEHVYVETKVGADWVPLDSTVDVPSGWAPRPPFIPDRPTAFMVEYI